MKIQSVLIRDSKSVAEMTTTSFIKKIVTKSSKRVDLGSL